MKRHKYEPGLPAPTETSAQRTSRLQAIADKHNASLIPEQPGVVRVDGPRRQYRAEVRGRILHYVEI